MRPGFLLLVLVFSVAAHAQPDLPASCKPTINITPLLCGRINTDSTICLSWREHLVKFVVSDTSISIISFHITAGGEGFDGYVMEADNTGPELSTPYARNIIAMVRPGSYVQFSCIKARDKAGRNYVLQPVFIEMK